jgi:3-mercaptopyruvate sulfurtransferase SseA
MRMSQIISQAMAIAAAWTVLGAVSAAQTHQHADQAANAAQTAASNVVVSVADFQALAKSSKAKIIDTRLRKNYDKGHIPGAISLPWVDLNVSESGGNRTNSVRLG